MCLHDLLMLNTYIGQGGRRHVGVDLQGLGLLKYANLDNNILRNVCFKLENKHSKKLNIQKK